MAAVKILTQNTTFSIDDSSSTPVAINGVRSWSRQDGESTQIEVTTLASVAREYCQGLKDGGTLSLEYIWDDDDLGQLELQDASDNQSTRTFIITTSDGSTATMEVIVLSLGETGEADNVIIGTANLKITGAITRA